MSMTSQELNDAIRKLEHERDYLEGPGGKVVPYIGWFWRTVDFDKPAYSFGIIPGEFVGFMENNKWDYEYTRQTTPEEWAEIKGLLEELVANPCREAANAVWNAVQKIGD